MFSKGESVSHIALTGTASGTRRNMAQRLRAAGIEDYSSLKGLLNKPSKVFKDAYERWRKGKATSGNGSRSSTALAEEAAEAAAQRWLTRLQGSIKRGHFLTEHSPLKKLRDLYNRAVYGIKEGGVQSYKTNATRFFKYTDMKEAIGKATRSYKASGGTGQYSVTIDMVRNVGEGYYKTTGVYGVTSKVVVNFNKFGQVYTAFPKLP